MSTAASATFSPFIVLQYGTLFFFIFIIKAAQKKVNHNRSLVKSLEKNQETAGLNPFAFFGTQRGSGIYFLAYSDSKIKVQKNVLNRKRGICCENFYGVPD